MMELLESEERFSYGDYITWDDGMRYELIDGILYMMAPAPSQSHQDVSVDLMRQLTAFLFGKPCKVYHAPFDVRLNVDSDDNTVVQPDLFVVCDRSKLDGKCCIGAPDLVVEILSPSTAEYDQKVKYQKYLEAGVREYWIVDPAEKTVEVFLLQNKSYIRALYENTGRIPVSVLSGCEITLETLFAE